MEFKYCEGCDSNKNTKEFGTRIRKNGNIYIFKKCKECERIRKKQPEYKKKISSNRKKKYNEDNEYRKTIIEKSCKYYKENTTKIKKYQKDYHKRKTVIERRHQRRYNRRQNDEEYRIMCNLSSRICKLLKSNKDTRSLKLIGCSPIFFKKWLEWQFNSNMSWDNYGKYWHIDHVIPCNSFELMKKNEQYKCFHWSNCQPLEKTKNIIKSDKIIPKQLLLQEIKVYYYNKSYLQHTL